MSIRWTRASKYLAAAALFAGCSAFAAQVGNTDQPQAISNLARANKPAASAADKAAELGLLTSAYDVLTVADHDYKGHRLHAMRAIELACDELGSNIRGRGKGHQPQPTSDAEIAAARNSVQQACTMATTNNQKRVAFHLNHAIADLNQALATK